MGGLPGGSRDRFFPPLSVLPLLPRSVYAGLEFFLLWWVLTPGSEKHFKGV